MNFFTCAYVFNPAEAQAMAEAGVDAVIAHLETTVGGKTGIAPELVVRLEQAPALVQAIGEAAWAVDPEVILLCHGGPLATPEDAAYVLSRSDALGFVGASSMERLPVERAITETVQQFKALTLRDQRAGRDGREPA
jgi:predicted TIM-barrel enzyme